MKYILVLLLVCNALLAEEDLRDEQWFSGSDLEAYKVNYFCPASYRDKSYTSFIKDTEYKHTEVEVQISIKYNVAKNIFGLGGKYYASYSQHAFWQLYTTSKPFRENIYNPELFARYDIKSLNIEHLDSLQLGYEHQSNGNPDTTYTTVDGEAIGNISRGINTLYATVGLIHGNLHTDLRVWYPIFSLEDNPDIMDYIGYTGLGVKYFAGEEVFSMDLRGNLATKKGSVEVAYAYPVGRAVNLYFKVFSGYTETLIDYKNYVNKFSIGFSFSR
ncbi:phospholipase A [Sulfurimonas microaerophilic]|uniref:phospholipase A n=1 Tax=Sulfurimonas microaerophilic TaxID=3058392 RepID=UPI00271522A4|nr:phospholipase A [Sulfurimonas sp. hsl 1-7]